MNDRLTRRMRLVTAVSAVGLAGGMLAMATAPAGAATTSRHVSRPAHMSLSAIPAPGVRPNATFSITNYHSGKCLGTSAGQENANAVQWTCNGHPDQQWQWENPYPGDTAYLQLVNSLDPNGSGDCLGIAGGSTSVGAQAVAWYCYGSSRAIRRSLIVSDRYVM